MQVSIPSSLPAISRGQRSGRASFPLKARSGFQQPRAASGDQSSFDTSHISRLSAPSSAERRAQVYVEFDDNDARSGGPRAEYAGGVAPMDNMMPATIKVLGCGGGGSNAVNRMAMAGLRGVGLYIMNTDAQALSSAAVPPENRLQIGRELTRGLGAGGNPDIGQAAARESQAEIARLVDGCDMVFVTAGMGGGTGSGSAPEVARIAKSKGILTVGIVTLPFSFEGRLRRQQALEAVVRLREAVDTIIVVPNDKLLETVGADVSVTNAFKMADAVLQSGVRGISDIIQLPGLVNVDFADVKTIMTNAGTALMGQGVASGKGRAAEAARAALSSPLLDVDISSATGIVWNITGPSDMTLFEVNSAAEVIYSTVSPDTNIIFGAGEDAAAQGAVTVTLIATGIQAAGAGRADAVYSGGAAEPRGTARGAPAPRQAPRPAAPRQAPPPPPPPPSPPRGGGESRVPKFLRRK